jgi:hypothetical protein
MTHIRNDRASRPRRRTGTTLVLAAASGGLLAAAMAGSPIARADDPFTDIANDIQSSFTIGEEEYSDAATAFATAGGTNAGLGDAVAGFDNIFISPADYTLLGLTAAGTDTDFGSYGEAFFIGEDIFPPTALGEESAATAYSGEASNFFSGALTDLSDGKYFLAVDAYLVGGYDDLLAGQADALAGLFTAGI